MQDQTVEVSSDIRIWLICSNIVYGAIKIIDAKIHVSLWNQKYEIAIFRVVAKEYVPSNCSYEIGSVIGRAVLEVNHNPIDWDSIEFMG